MDRPAKERMDNKQTINSYPWAERFIELSLRALRHVHYDFGISSLGHQWMQQCPSPKLINIGHGVAYADELTICSAITQECISSQLLSGVFVPGNSNGIKQGFRFYRIDREKTYENSRCRVDISVQRVDPYWTETSSTYCPCFIEAKRVRHWRPQEQSSPRYDLKGIKADIQKLRKEIAKLRGKLFCHLLIWNIYEGEPDGPISLLEKLGDNYVKLHQIRWMPIYWNHFTTETHKNSVMEPPPVEKWLWVALFEVLAIPKHTALKRTRKCAAP